MSTKAAGTNEMVIVESTENFAFKTNFVSLFTHNEYQTEDETDRVDIETLLQYCDGLEEDVPSSQILNWSGALKCRCRRDII